jgi:hypothetical protein
MKRKIQFALTAVLLAVFAAVFAGEAAAAQRLSYSVTNYETTRNSNGILQVTLTIKFTNIGRDERVITRLYDLSFVVTADIKSLTSGKTYKMSRYVSYNTFNDGEQLDLWPGKSTTARFHLLYNNFKGKGWKWEGEEKTGKPPLTNFKTSDISVKYETREP